MAENKKITFVLPEETTITEVIEGILRNNGIAENAEEFLDKFIEDIEPKTTIIKDAATTIIEKKITEEKLVELLQKHLETSVATAQKIIQDIKQKITPFAKITNITKGQEELIQKLKSNENVFNPDDKTEDEILMPYLKKAPIIDVEENAENMEKKGENTTTEEKGKFPLKTKIPKPQENKSDTYREPIE